MASQSNKTKGSNSTSSSSPSTSVVNGTAGHATPKPEVLFNDSPPNSTQQKKPRRRNGPPEVKLTDYKVDLWKIIQGNDTRTTIMVKNIPNKYNQVLLLELFSRNYAGKFDFFYLPIDFKNKCNVGYAFINFLDATMIISFHEEFNGKRWERFNSEKICELTYARIQGRNALANHFEYSSVMFQEDAQVKPVILPSNIYV